MSVSRAFVLTLLALPAGASAQGFSASRYLAPPSGEDLAVTERALVAPHLRVGAVVVGEYTHALSAAGGVVVDHRVTAHVGATLGLFDRLQLGVVMPVVITQQRAGASDGLSAGDLRLDARVRVAGLARGGTVRLALAASVSAPLGDASAYAGDGAVTVAPRVLFEATNGRDFVFALNAGVALRPGWEHQMFARAAVTIPLVPRVLVAVEGAFEARLNDPGAAGSLALELLGGVRHVSRRGSGSSLGGCVGHASTASRYPSWSRSRTGHPRASGSGRAPADSSGHRSSGSSTPSASRSPADSSARGGCGAYPTIATTRATSTCRSGGRSRSAGGSSRTASTRRGSPRAATARRSP